MKRYFLLSLLLISSFVFASCNSPESGGRVDIAKFRDNLAKGDFMKNEDNDPQVIIPEENGDKNDFEQPLTEEAKKNGLTETDIDEVRQQLADSFELDISEVQITAERESTPRFMTGYVNVGEGEKGGIYFAAKTDEGWMVAHNGMGVVVCDLVDEYNFPAGMVPKCYDMSSGISKER